MGADHVLWGTDSVWYGSPQWQIEAFRRLEIPEDMQAGYGFQPPGGDRSEVKKAILWDNGARFYGIDQKTRKRVQEDRIARVKRQSGHKRNAFLDELVSR